MHRHATLYGLLTLWFMGTLNNQRTQSATSVLIEDVVSHVIGGAQAYWNRSHL